MKEKKTDGKSWFQIVFQIWKVHILVKQTVTKRIHIWSVSSYNFQEQNHLHK